MEMQAGDDAGNVAMTSCVGMPCMQYGGGAYSGVGLLESGAGGSGGGGVWRPPEHLDTVHLEDILEQVDGKQQSGVTSSVQPDPPDQSVPLLHYPLQVKEDPDWPDSPYGSDPLPVYFPHHETLTDPYAHPSSHPVLQYPALHHQSYPDYSQLQAPLPPPPDSRRTLQLLPAQSVANPALQLHQQHQLHQLSYPTPFRPTHTPLRLSSSAPSYLPAAAQARHQLASFSSVSTGVVSPASQMSLLDDGNDSHDDWDTDDADHSSSRSRSDLMSPSSDRKDRYFWQYNVHSKGPKGQRVMRSQRVTNPFQVEDAVDPVFSTHYHIEGIKHSGKARRGDGNDLTPRPRKLLAIRYDLDRISRLINDIHPVTSLHVNQSSHHVNPAPSLPFNGRQNSRKEKNKLASRACRLKKKAQHEANKIQLSGLREEHAQMTCVVREMLQILRARLNRNGPAIAPDEATRRIDGLFSMANRQQVAGRLPEYVQAILTDSETGRAAHHAPGMRPFIALSMIE